MPGTVCIHQCTCSECQSDAHPAVRGYHQQINLLLSRLNEPQRRWYLGTLSLAPDAPTDGELSGITGLDEKTIRRGRRELQGGLAGAPAERQRHAGGGRPRAEKKTPPSKLI